MTTKKSKEEESGSGGRGVRVGRYELGRTLGEGNFGKVKLARRVDTGRCFAVKVVERKRVLDLHVHDQIKREIATLKLLRHPNVVRLYEVLASKTKIYMVLEYVNGGELFDKIESKGRLSEHEGRKLFQQIIDAVSYCHGKGVFHRDLKPENVLLDEEGNVKISDFGLSALPQQFGNDGLLHTTCGSPNYVAPEVLANRGYDGAKADIWSCGVVLYVILTGSLPFDDRNLAVLYHKIQKGDVKIPRWLSPGAQNMIRRILDPNPQTRMSMVQIKENKWFNQGYAPVLLEGDDDDDAFSDDGNISIKEVTEAEKQGHDFTHITAFELIGMSSCLDLSGFFEEEDSSERKIRFTSSYEPRELFDKIEDIMKGMGFQVHRGHGKLKITQQCTINATSHGPKMIHSFSVTAEVFELGPSLCVVELRKSSGDSSLYRQLCAKLSANLRNCQGQELFLSSHLMAELIGSEGERTVVAAA